MSVKNCSLYGELIYILCQMTGTISKRKKGSGRNNKLYKPRGAFQVIPNEFQFGAVSVSKPSQFLHPFVNVRIS